MSDPPVSELRGLGVSPGTAAGPAEAAVPAAPGRTAGGRPVDLMVNIGAACADLAERGPAADGPAEARALARTHHNGDEPERTRDG
ncbi:hypothetical protein [Actinomadura sp. 3N407]|uniref:hypothetical protein n=1 Tax=Actinomadura sp. 3N407 TaxID=3457423 RepID=UPI003FCE945B